MDNIKAVIFDLDGTLLDSMYVWDQVDREFLHKRGFDVPDFYQKECAVRSFYETAVYTIDLFTLNETPEQVMREWSDLAIKEYSENVRLMPYAKDILEKCKESGIRCAVCTSLSPELYRPVLKNNGISEYFEVIVSASEYGKGKQTSDIFLHTAEQLGVMPEECVVIDDVAQALCSAKEAGMYAIGIFCGRNDQIVSCQNLDLQHMEKCCDKVICSLKEIL